MTINIVYGHLKADDAQSLRRGAVTVIWSAKPIIGCDIYVYWDAFSYTGRLPGFNVLLLGEPISVLPGQFRESVWKEFDHIVTYYEAIASEEKNISYIFTPRLGWAHYPAAIEKKEERELAYPLRNRKQAICMIAGYKQSTVEGELYSKRLEIARWFGEHSSLSFDVYGYPPFPLSNYRGALVQGSNFTKESKYRTLAKYKFSVAFENIYHLKYSRGYVSEKMLDCFETRTVPIYLGCSNIEDYIPSSCFIDMRLFATYQDLNNYLVRMSESEYLQYIANIDTWVEAGNLSKYSCQGLYDRIVEIFTRRTHCPVPSDYTEAKEWTSLPIANAREKLGMETQVPPKWTWDEMATKCVDTTPLISIMIISYNGIDKIKACIESIKRNTPESHEIVVVDNARNDGSLDYVKTVPGTIVIANPTNIGYSPARTQAMSLVKGKYVISLDDDTIVTKGWADKFIRHAESHPDVGIIGPRSNYVSGPQIVKNASYSNIAELEAFAEAWSNQNHNHVTKAIRLIGFCMFIPRKVIDKIGCIDPAFGKLFGFDDDDYSLRTQIAGFKLFIADDIFIHHTGGPQGKGDKQYNELMLGAWEMFKEKWGIKKDIPYGSPYDVTGILSRKFDKSKHYAPPYELSILEKYISRPTLSADGKSELPLAKLATAKLTTEEATILGIIEPIGGWFTKAEVLSLHRLIKPLSNSAKILEIGSYRGRSTNAIGYAMHNTCMELYCLDVWRDFMGQGIRQLDDTANLLPPTDFAIFEDFLRNVEKFGDKIRILRGSTAEFARLLPEQFFDLIFVDAAHDYENVRRDILVALKCIKPGGIICGHDFHSGGAGVIRAVNELIFSSTALIEYGVIEGTSIWFARYRSNGPARPNQIEINKINNGCGEANSAMSRDDLLPHFKEEKAITGLTSIIILTHNHLEQMKKWLKSIRKHTPEQLEIIFVDCDSNESTLKWLRNQVSENKNYHLLEDKENLGVTKGQNKGINISQGEFIVLMDNDVLAGDGWLTAMLQCLQHSSDAGIVGPMSNNAVQIQQVSDPSYQSPDDLNQYAKKFKELYRHRRIPARNIDGFCMLFKRTLAEKIGLLDEHLGSHFAAEDFCLRAALEGCSNYVAGDVFIHHFGGKESTGDRSVINKKWTLKTTDPEGKKLVILRTMESADELYSNGKTDQAVSMLINCIKLTPEAKEIYYELTRIFIESKKLGQAWEVIESMPETAKNGQKGLEYAGYVKEGSGQDGEALSYVDKILTINERSAAALNLRGILAYKEGKKENAESDFMKAIGADPGYGEAYTNLGVLYWGVDKKEEALKYLKKGFTLSPTIPDVSSLYYSVLSSLGAYDETEADLQNASKLYPHNKNIAFLYIDTLIQQGKLSSAMTEIENALVKFGLEEETLQAALAVREKIGPRQIDKAAKKTTLSFCLIVKNEERHLVNCLKSIRDVADEIIIVDTGSTDKTIDIARTFGAKVFDFLWTGDFSEARNHSLDQATGDWIFVLDADEVISPSDHKQLLKIIARAKQRPVALEIISRNYLSKAGTAGWTENDGTYPEEEKGVGWSGSNKVRLIRNNRLVRFENPVHELLETSLNRAGIPIEKCDIPVHHYGRLDQEKLMAKGRDYYQLGRKKLEERGGGDFVALRELAAQAGELGLFEEAIDLWQQTLSAKPDNVESLFNLGYHYMQIGKYSEALEASKRAVELSPGTKDAVLNYALAEMFLGNAPKASNILEGFLSGGNDNPTLAAVLGVSYCCDGNMEKGLAIFKELAGGRIKNISYYVNSLATQLISSRQTEYAELLIEAAILGQIADQRTLNLRNDARLKQKSPAISSSREEG